MAPLVTLLTSALCIWLAQMAYWLPLKRRENYRLRFLLDFVATVPFAQVITWANSGRTSAPMLLVIYGGFFLWVSISTKLCTPLDAAASAYCSVWIVLTSESIYELWRLLIWGAAKAGLQQPALATIPMMLGQIGFTLAVCILVRYTAARLMPDEGLYRIGPRQLLSAGLLGGMFVFQFFALMSTLQNTGVGLVLVAPAFLTQLYCLTLLYLQTELFKKSAMQKEMDTLNLLYERQRQQYQIARQNVQIINRKCHELKVQIADLRRLNPDAAQEKDLNEAERAVQRYDANADTGIFHCTSDSDRFALCQSRFIIFLNRLQCLNKTGRLIYDLTIRKRLTGTDRIAVTDFPWSDTYFVCHHIQQGFCCKTGLGYTKPAKRSGRRIVGIISSSFNLEILIMIGTCRMSTCTFQHRTAK